MRKKINAPNGAGFLCRNKTERQAHSHVMLLSRQRSPCAKRPASWDIYLRLLPTKSRFPGVLIRVLASAYKGAGNSGWLTS